MKGFCIQFAQLSIVGVLACTMIIMSVTVSAECQAPREDYIHYFGLPEDLQVLRSPLSLNNFGGFALTSIETCGSRGCEYGFYGRKNADDQCPVCVFDFTGSYKLGVEMTNGFNQILVTSRDTYLSEKKTRRYCFSTEEAYFTGCAPVDE